jgi:hypothetical protein
MCENREARRISGTKTVEGTAGVRISHQFHDVYTYYPPQNLRLIKLIN